MNRDMAGGLKLTGEGGVLQQLTKRLLESALDGEIADQRRLRQARSGGSRERQLAQRRPRQDRAP